MIQGCDETCNGGLAVGVVVQVVGPQDITHDMGRGFADEHLIGRQLLVDGLNRQILLGGDVRASVQSRCWFAAG